MNALDLKTTNGKTIFDIIMAPLIDLEIDLSLIDVGARGGMHDLPKNYASHVQLVGFEPNKDEFTDLVKHETHAEKEGFIPPRWKKETFKELALWNRLETRPIYIYNDTGAVTLMGDLTPDICKNIYSEFPWLSGKEATTLSTLFDVRKLLTVGSVRCDRLDNVWRENSKIDYLKIDVEGAELRVLQGARKLLEAGQILFIKTEFQCVPLYKDSENLPGAQFDLLNDYGYRLLDIEHHGGGRGSHWTYSRCDSRIPESVDRKLLLTGDAFFALDPDRLALSDADLQRLGLISIALGFRSFGLSVLRDAKLLNVADLDMIEDALAHVRLRRKLRLTWENFPHKFAKFLYTQLRR